MAVSETPRHKLRKYGAGTDPHPGRGVHNAEADKLEAMPAIRQGTVGARPVAGIGKVLFWDEANKRFAYDDGTSWQDVAPTGGVTPTQVATTGYPSEGSSTRAARGDHTHVIPLVTDEEHGAMRSTDKAKLDAATRLSTANTIARRGNAGEINVSAPSASENATNKAYVDHALAEKANTGHTHNAATADKAGFMSSHDKTQLDSATWLAEPRSIARRGASGEMNVLTTSDKRNAASKEYVDAADSLQTGKIRAEQGSFSLAVPGDNSVVTKQLVFPAGMMRKRPHFTCHPTGTSPQLPSVDVWWSTDESGATVFIRSTVQFSSVIFTWLAMEI